MIQITLPDGSKRDYASTVTVAEVAASIGAGLSKAALAGKIDGKLVDTGYAITHDSPLSIITAKDTDGMEVIRHSTAHLLAYAVKELFADAQVTIGPVIEHGFFYDFSYKRPFTLDDLAAIEKKMTELASKMHSHFGSVWLAWRMTSMPLMSGRPRSTSSTSGLRRSSMASPSPAVPTLAITSKSGSCESICA